MQSLINNLEAIQKQFGDKYKNPEKCGSGVFSEVFKCRNKNGEFVAIKVVDIFHISSQMVPQLKNENELLTKSDNQNIIKLYEYQESDTSLFFVLEYCEMDVMTMMTQYYNNKIPEDIVIVILKNIINGLQYLHKNNIIHRDLKLNNLGVVIKKEDLINLAQKKENKYDSIFKQASYKLLDLGLAKQLVNQTKSFKGTLFNMAPEVIEGKLYSFQADIYSLGVCLYQMITGEYPYQSTSQKKQFEIIKRQGAKFQGIENQLLRNTIQQMLQFDVEKRLTFQELYQSKLIINQQGTQPSILEISLTINSKFYSLNESKIINQQVAINQLNEQNNQNQQIDQQIQNQRLFFENLKQSKIKIQSQQSQIDQTQEFSVIEYPQYLKKSQIGKPKFQLESNLEIIQLAEIPRWKRQKNICILILNLCKKLKTFIKLIPSYMNYISFETEFNNYLQYYCKLAEILFNELQVEVNSKTHYQTIQEYIIFKDSLKNIQFINLQDMQSNGFSNRIYNLRTSINRVDSIVQIKDNDTLENSQRFIQKNNITLFNQIINVSQNISNNKDNASQGLNQVYCHIYLLLVDLVILRAEYQNKNTISDDNQIIELKPEDFKNNPDNICSYLYEIMQQHQFMEIY